MSHRVVASPPHIYFPFLPQTPDSYLGTWPPGEKLIILHSCDLVKMMWNCSGKNRNKWKCSVVVSEKTSHTEGACLLPLYLEIFHLAVWNFDGVAGVLVILLDQDKKVLLRRQSNELEGAWATIPAFDHLSLNYM